MNPNPPPEREIDDGGEILEFPQQGPQVVYRVNFAIITEKAFYALLLWFLVSMMLNLFFGGPPGNLSGEKVWTSDHSMPSSLPWVSDMKDHLQALGKEVHAHQHMLWSLPSHVPDKQAIHDQLGKAADEARHTQRALRDVASAWNGYQAVLAHCNEMAMRDADADGAEGKSGQSGQSGSLHKQAKQTQVLSLVNKTTTALEHVQAKAYTLHGHYSVTTSALQAASTKAELVWTQPRYSYAWNFHAAPLDSVDKPTRTRMRGFCKDVVRPVAVTWIHSDIDGFRKDVQWILSFLAGVQASHGLNRTLQVGAMDPQAWLLGTATEQMDLRGVVESMDKYGVRSSHIA